MKTIILPIILAGTVLLRAQEMDIHVTCICSPDQATGAIELEVGSDMEGAIWSWTGPEGFAAPFQSIYGLEDTGTYSLVANLPGGDSLVIEQWVGYCFDIESSVQGGTGGAGFTIAVEVTGDGPFEYAWSMFDGTGFDALGVHHPIIGGLPPGYYAVEIRQAAGNCRVFEAFTLSDNGAFLMSTCMPTSAGDSSRLVKILKSGLGKGEWLVRDLSGDVLWRESISLTPRSSEVQQIFVPPHLDAGLYTLEIREGGATLMAAPLLR